MLSEWVGWWVLDFARLKLSQPSKIAGAGAELGKNQGVMAFYIIEWFCEAL